MKNISTKLQKLYNGFHISYSKLHIKHDLNNSIKKNTKESILTKKQKREIKEFYKPYTKVNTKYHNFYYSKTGKFYKEYLPDDTYYCNIDMFYNNWITAPVLDNKCYYKRILPNIKQPSTIACRINNMWFNNKMDIISLKELEKIIENEKQIVIKQATESSGGHGVYFIDKASSDIKKEFSKYIKNIKPDLIIRKIIKQNRELSKLNSSSLNTIRILSFLEKNGETKIYSSIIRMGIGNSKVDNASSGGITCGINSDGSLKNVAYKANGEKFLKHPTSGIHFNSIVIPKYNEMIELVKKTHPLLPMSRLISWDLAVDENNEIILIEFSLKYGELDFHQLNNGPLFGKDTKKILDEVYGKWKKEKYA